MSAPTIVAIPAKTAQRLADLKTQIDTLFAIYDTTCATVAEANGVVGVWAQPPQLAPDGLVFTLAAADPPKEAS